MNAGSLLRGGFAPGPAYSVEYNISGLGVFTFMHEQSVTRQEQTAPATVQPVGWRWMLCVFGRIVQMVWKVQHPFLGQALVLIASVACWLSLQPAVHNTVGHAAKHEGPAWMLVARLIHFSFAWPESRSGRSHRFPAECMNRAYPKPMKTTL